jgi:glyoxylase-like metal-dependent hydrolase (beta-lactamase superfamily II)
MSALKWALLTKKRDSSTQGIPPGKEHLTWVTNMATLLHGERDAVLVDTFLSAQQSRELVAWVVQSGRNLATIYITHAHADHYLGLQLVLDRFPNAKAVATAAVAGAIGDQITPDFVRSFWEPRFPGQLPADLAAPEALDGDTFFLEDHALKVVELGHTDTPYSTALHAPSIGMVISGDCVYNNTHLYLAECDDKWRLEWLHALDRSSPCSRQPSWRDMGCSIPTARRVTSRRLDDTSATSTRAWLRLPRPWSCTSGCCRCTPTG